MNDFFVRLFYACHECMEMIEWKERKCMSMNFFIFCFAYLCTLSCITEVNAMYVVMNDVNEGDS